MAKTRHDVEFRSSISKSINCICNACFNTDWVIRVSLPDTHYDPAGNLQTWYEEYWLCKKCRDKLVKALEWEEKEE